MSRSLLIVLAMTVPVLTASAQFGGRDAPTSSYLLQIGGNNLSPAVTAIVAQQLKLRPPGWGDAPPPRVEVEFQGQRLGAALILNLTVWVPSAANLENESEHLDVWNLARRELEKEMQRLAGLTYQAESTRLTRELDEQHAERKKLEERAEQVAEKIRMLDAKTAGLDHDSLAKAIAEAVSNRRGLQLEAAGIQARREAIEKRIDELREMAAAKGDPIVSELEKVVEIRQASSEAMKHRAATGKASQQELLEWDARLAEAKIELLRAQREAEDRVSGGALRELNNELSKLLVEAAKVHGQQKQLEQIVEELRKQVVSTAQAEAALAPLRTEMQAIVVQRQYVDNEIDNLRRSLDGLSEPAISLKPLTEEKADGEPEAAAVGESANGEDDAPDEQ
jgi:hypothetical protein